MQKVIGKLNSNKRAKIIIPIVIALISILIVSKFAMSPAFHAKTIAALDAKKTDVMKLTAASTGISTAITLLPGDVASPIADRLMDLSGWFLLVICAIYIEKYLLIITGFLTFVFLIPASCILYATNVFWKNPVFYVIAKKLLALGLALFCAIPLSVKLSNIIEDTYNYSVESTVSSASDLTEELEEDASDKKFSISNVISNAKESINKVIDKATNTLNDIIEHLAVMIVTSCVIPIAVLMFFIWLIRTILDVNISFPKVKPLKLSKHLPKEK